MNKHKFPYRWYLKDGYPEPNGLKVFTTFACGGGSSMGYKLAGFDVVGANDIDPKMAEVYKANHNPKHFYLESIEALAKRRDFPKEFYDLDILDGSPPCSNFSMTGNREKDWGKQKKFREGQADQVLDTLFFDFIDLAAHLRPKVVIAENVKGLIQGNAKSYVRRIKKEFETAGYKVQLFLLNAASMGVPQRRERVFFICQRNDLNLSKLRLGFNERGIVYKEIRNGNNKISDKQTTVKAQLWYRVKSGDCFAKYHKTGSFFNDSKLSTDSTVPTLTADPSHGSWDYEYCRMLDGEELCKAGSFPMDYNFLGIKPKYLIGMSVPPVMTAQVANQVYEQWLKQLS